MVPRDRQGLEGDVGAKVDEAPKERSAKTDPMVPPENWSFSLARALSLSLSPRL